MEDGRLKDIIFRILSVDQPDKIVLFGSRARQDNGTTSDFDIAIFGKVNLAKIHDCLEDAATLLNIDVIAFDEIGNKKLKNKILKEGVILYER